jgi:hypothetical protein
LRKFEEGVFMEIWVSCDVRIYAPGKNLGKIRPASMIRGGD